MRPVAALALGGVLAIPLQVIVQQPLIRAQQKRPRTAGRVNDLEGGYFLWGLVFNQFADRVPDDVIHDVVGGVVGAGGFTLAPVVDNPDQEIVYRDKYRGTYRTLHERIHRLAGGLTRLGVKPGDVVAVFDFDSHRYLECFFGIPGMGATLQTVNWRLAPEQVLWQNDRYLFSQSYQLEASELGYQDRETPAITATAKKFAETVITDLLEGF